MEIKGKVIDILKEQSGTSARGGWKKQDFIVETLDQFPKKICISNWNDKVPMSLLQKGNVVNLGVNVESREFNGKWYTEIKVWKVMDESGSVPEAGAGTGTPPPVDGDAPWGDEPPAENDDLPF